MLTNVIPELVRTLSQPEMTSPGLLVLKTSSKFGLPIAWITGHTTIPQPAELLVLQEVLQNQLIFGFFKKKFDIEAFIYMDHIFEKLGIISFEAFFTCVD